METPELDKMLEVKDKTQMIGEFLEWLGDKQDIELCEYDVKPDEHYPINTTTEQLLAAFFEIDLEEAEKERQGILAELQAKNDNKET